MVITAACRLMAQGREAGRRLKKIWCLSSEGGRNAEERRGHSRGGVALKEPRNRKPNTLSSFSFLNFKCHSSSGKVKPWKVTGARRGFTSHRRSRSTSFNGTRNICLLRTLDRPQHTLEGVGPCPPGPS